MNRTIAFHKIQPVIDHVAPIANADAALREFKAAKHFGKVVLSIA